MNPDEEQNCRQNMIKRLFLAGLAAVCVCGLAITEVAEAASSTGRTLEGPFKNLPDSALESDLYAYYTRLDYQIPLSEIDMDVPFSNAEHIRAYWKAREAPAIPSDAPRPKNPILKIGAASPNFGSMFEGSIDQVGIYNRKLSREDLVRLAAGKAVDAALVANYQFNPSTADGVGGKFPEAGKPLTVASDKLAHPEKTIRRARNNLPRCVDTEDKKLTDLAHSLYEKCLFDKLWEPKLPGLPYRWFSISGANDSAYGKCQLLWDTMFILNAWASLDDDELMRDVFHNYWHVIDSNPEAPRGSYRYGMIPCTIKPQLPYEGYSQIPILGWGCQRVFQQTNDSELLELCLPYLDAFLNWYSTERDTDDDGLIEYGAYKKCSIADIVQTARFETFDFQATLDNLKLTKHPRRASGGGWYGNIEGVDQTCFLLMSERAMAEMAKTTGNLEMAAKYEKNMAKRISAMRNKMWDPKTNFFYSLDRDSDQRIPVRTLQGFLAMTCGAASPEQAACLARQLQDPKQWWPEYPVTTTAMNEPTFDPKGFWRGDMWPPTNYLITLGLNRYGYYDMAKELTDKMLQLVEKHDGRSFERYDGTRGIPLGVPDYCWGVTIWSMIVHNVYGVQEDYRTIVVPPHAKGRRLKLGKLELSYPSDKSLQVRSEFEREFRVRFPGQSGEIKVHCNGESVEVLQKDVAVPEVVFIALSHKTYIVSMD